MHTLEERIDTLGIRATVKEGSDKWPPFELPPGSTSWTVTLRLEGRQMTTPFYQGPALTKPPEVADVLDCMLSDARIIEDTPDWEEFAADCGYDRDSLSGYQTWQAATRQTKRLRRFLGEHYESLLWDTERL